MTITDVKIRHMTEDPHGRVKAIVSVTLDGAIAIHDIKIIQGVDRLFAAMPNRHSLDGRRQDIVHPISSEARQEVERAILDSYFREMEKEAHAS